MTPGRIKFLIALGSAIRNGAVKTIKQAMNFAEQQFGKIDKSFVDDIVNVFKKEGKIKKKGEVVPIKKQEGIVRRPEEFATRKEYERYLDETLGPPDDVFGSPMKDDLLKEWDKVNAKNVTPKKVDLSKYNDEALNRLVDEDIMLRGEADTLSDFGKDYGRVKEIEKRRKEIREILEAAQKNPELVGGAKEGIMATDEAAEVVKKRTDDIAKGDPTGETSDLIKGLEDKMTGIKKAADEMKEIADKTPKSFVDFWYAGTKARDPRQGVVRAAAREILNKNKVNIGREDPIDVLRKMYGEDGLEAIDAVSDSLLDAQSYGEMNTILKNNKLFDLVPKKTYGYDQSVVSAEKIRKAKEQEAKQKKILEDFDTTDRTKNAHGGLIDILKL